MIDTKQLALIKKDIRSITSNKRVFSVMLIVPLVLTIIMPSIFVLTIIFAPDSVSDFQKLLDMLPISVKEGSQEQIIVSLLLNKIMPIFFLMIPIMASSVMAASSFAGEKEKRTLETLLYSPLSLKQIFQAKVFASFSVSMIVSFISFASMIAVVELEVMLITKSMVLPDVSWIIVMLLVAPSISLVAITVTVRGSAKAQTIEDAQQRAVFLILPIIFIIVGQFMGVILLNIWIVLGVGIALSIIAFLLLKGSMRNFTYEALLK